MNRRTFVGTATAVVAAIFARPVRAARQWHETIRKPPNGVELGGVVHFTGPVLEAHADALHRKLDSLIAQARRELAARPDFNVWRLGQLRLRYRIGRATTPFEWAIVKGATPHPPVVWPPHCHACGQFLPVDEDGQPLI